MKGEAPDYQAFTHTLPPEGQRAIVAKKILPRGHFNLIMFWRRTTSWERDNLQPRSGIKYVNGGNSRRERGNFIPSNREALIVAMAMAWHEGSNSSSCSSRKRREGGIEPAEPA